MTPVVVTCEHASNRLPRAYGRLGLSARVLASHRAWDPGAAEVARRLARRLGAPLHLGHWSRLLVDLNRSPHHKGLIPSRAFGLAVPGNRALSPAERGRRILRYYAPYRAAVLAAIDEAMRECGFCLHVSVHSFTPRFMGQVRNADVGFLYDSARRAERDLAVRAAESLRKTGFLVRFNYPYRGTADGLTVFCRRAFAKSAYVGVEVELNQRLLTGRTDAATVTSAIVDSLSAAVLSRLG